jgi:hypothetical protein
VATEDGSGTPDARCVNNDIECEPKAVIDFDNFYQIHPTTEFYRLDDLLSTSANVDLIAAEARRCVLDKVFDTKLGERNGTALVSTQYTFTVDQLELMIEKVTYLKDKYSVAPYDTDAVAQELVSIMTNYLSDLEYERDYEAGLLP